jgi:hypothetical protein
VPNVAAPQFLRPKQAPQPSAKQTGRLLLQGRLAALLSPLQQLRSLGVEEQQMDQADWEAVCRATTIEVQWAATSSGPALMPFRR